VLLQVNEGKMAGPVAFSTCYAAGCIAPLSLDAKTLAALRVGTTLKVKVMPHGGADELQFPVSLKGFGQAFDRVVALLQ
jgi:invasion protein IalB